MIGSALRAVLLGDARTIRLRSPCAEVLRGCCWECWDRLEQRRDDIFALERTRLPLCEADTLALWRSSGDAGFTEHGPATRLRVTVKTPASSHQVQWSNVEIWLQSEPLIVRLNRPSAS